MPTAILMPALSPTMEEGTLATWHVKEGDTISSGDVIAEIETDKATMEVEAVEEGRLAKILIPADTENVAVNTPIAILLEEDEDDSALDGFDPGGGKAVASTADKAADETAPEAAPTPAPAPAPAAPTAPQTGDRVFSSPLARRIAGQEGIDLAGLTGSGPKGRIVKKDVEAAIASGTGKQKVGQIAGAAAAGVPELAARTEPSFIPFDSMRKTVAKRMKESKNEVPHFYLTAEANIDTLLSARKRLNETRGSKVSVNDFIIKACAHALMAEPDANVTFASEGGKDGRMMHATADISVAVALDGGLVTPVVKSCELKGLVAISEAMQDLAARARDRKLAPEEYQGGSFSISNLGMFGVKEFSAVINPPQGAILAVGAGEKRPVVLPDGSLGAATMMSMTLSCDHRTINGDVGAKLLKSIKMHLEDPMLMLG